MTMKNPSPVRASNPMLDVAYIAVFAALIIVLGFVSVPVGVTGVPIVLQNAAIILTGLVLGPYRGFLTAALFLGLGLIGLPVLAGGKSTLAALPGPTIGYLVGYLVSAFIAGLIAYSAPHAKSAAFKFSILAGIAALCSQYLLGSIGLMLRADMAFPPALASNTPFIVFDLIKLAAVVAIAGTVHTAFPDIRRKKLAASAPPVVPSDKPVAPSDKSVRLKGMYGSFRPTNGKR